MQMLSEIVVDVMKNHILQLACSSDTKEVRILNWHPFAGQFNLICKDGKEQVIADIWYAHMEDALQEFNRW